MVFGALAGNSVDFRAMPVFGEGAQDNTRGACAPLWEFHSRLKKIFLSHLSLHLSLGASKNSTLTAMLALLTFLP